MEKTNFFQLLGVAQQPTKGKQAYSPLYEISHKSSIVPRGIISIEAMSEQLSQLSELFYDQKE